MTTNSTSQGSDRFERQKELIATAHLRNASVTIIGVGAIGRQVAIQLASLGVGKIQLIDFGEVEHHHLTSHGFRHHEIGNFKVAATLSAIAEIDPEIQVESWCDRFRHSIQTNQMVLCCVDSTQARALIWNQLKSRTKFWADARMLGEVIRILTATDDKTRLAYGKTLLAQSDAHTGSSTSHSTIYTASVAAGLVVHQFTRWLRDLSLDSDQCLNLLNSVWSPD